ncbi:MAG: hypothetical protein KAQ92_03740 [Candidatus Aenigmarchaeota archaeon]|nr:hypothetical protein [Candidatus Aenigmarchaeota archaeon]
MKFIYLQKTDLEELKQKAKHVYWNNENRTEHFGLIGKKINDKKKLRVIGYLVWDLENFK